MNNRYHNLVPDPLGEDEVLLPGPPGLSVGERELITAFLIKINRIDVDYSIHAEAARYFMDPFIVDSFLEGENSEVLSRRLSTLMIVASDIQALDALHLLESVDQARKYGASDQDIADTVAIAANFSNEK